MNTEKFLEYIKENFPGVLDTHFNYELVENLCNFISERYGHIKGETAFLLSDIIPEVEAAEIQPFCNW